MKTIKRRIFSIFCILGMLLSITLPVAAATSNTFIQGYTLDETFLQVYTSIPEREKGTFEATLSGVIFTDPQMRSSKDEPVTWYCMVDISGSISDMQMEQEKRILNTICDLMTDKDQMLIVSLGNDMTKSDFMSDKNKIHDYIEAICVIPEEDTNLYKGIVESVKELKTNTAVTNRKCLVILSDGQDDQKAGYTREEATDAAKNALFPIYTVGVLTESPSDHAAEYAEVLGSFSRISTGGRHYVPMIDGIDPEEAAKEIVELNKESQILGYDLTTLTEEDARILSESASSTQNLRITFTTENGKKYEDSIIIYSEDIKLQVSDSEEETSIVSTPQPEPEPEPEVWYKKIPVWGWGLGICVIVLLLIVALLLIRKRKNVGKELEEPEIKEEITEGSEPSEEDSSGNNINIEEDKKNVIPQYQVTFSAVKYPDITFSYEMEEGKVYFTGRNDKADLILKQDDKKLSSRHCEMILQNNSLYIRDGSTNGTWLNGVRITGSDYQKCENSSVLTMGSYDYRICWVLASTNDI